MNRIFILSLSILLSACVSSVSMTRSSISNAEMNEASAWQRYSEAVDKECFRGRKFADIKQRDALKLSQCLSQCNQDIVMPNAMYPDILLSIHSEMMQNAELYHSGKISNAEWQKRDNTLAPKYYALKDARAIQQINTAQINDQERAARWQAAMAAAGQAIQQQRAVNAANNQAMMNVIQHSPSPYAAPTYVVQQPPLYRQPTTTSCRTIGNTLYCNTN